MLVKTFRASDGATEKPCYGQIAVCWAEKEDEARRIAHEWGPVTAVPGKLMTELGAPAEFETVSQLITEAAVASKIVCGPDPSRHIFISTK